MKSPVKRVATSLRGVSDRMGEIVMVGIAGGTGSGKTTIASVLCQMCLPDKSIIIDQDSYYKDRSHLPVGERMKCNFDEPDAIDFELLIEHLNQFRSGAPIARPVYCFKEHIRKKETIQVLPAEIVVVEGMLILCHPEVRNCLDLKVFVDAPADIRLIRRLQRDIGERGRDTESVIQQYVATVKPMHDLYVEPTRKYADLVVENGDSLNLKEFAVSPILDRINLVRGGGLR
jgi:uridine kinase